MILLISVLIIVHEAGHFVAARLCGVRVTRFGFGMPIGPSWKMFRWGNTDFYLHAFLFGGYVSFPDDNMDDDKKEAQEKEKELIPENELYESKTIGQKLFIVSAGVLMNVVFAIFLVIFAASYYHKLPASTQNIYIDSVSNVEASNISNYDVKKGDKILSINGTDINSFYQLTFYTRNSKLFDDYAINDLIQTNYNQLKKLNPKIDENIKQGTTIKLPKVKEEAPLKVNKNILSGLEKYKKEGAELTKEQIELRDKIYNKKVYVSESDITLTDIALALSDTYKPLNMVILRDGKKISLDHIVINKEGLLGITLKIEDNYTETKTIKDITVKSIDYLYSTTKFMLYSLWQLISGKVSASDMHGVIAIVKVGGDIISSKGMLNGILLTAMISINLAIMNFLPIPALDGGHVLFLIIEKLTGKKPTPELSEKINNFFFFLLILLMIAICYNDILALITKKF